MKKLFIVFLLSIGVIFSNTVLGTTITFVWDASTSPNIGGYKLYWGETSGAYTTSKDVGNVLTTDLTELVPEHNYFIAMKSYNSDKTVESGYSNEVSILVPKSIILSPPNLPIWKKVDKGFAVDLVPTKITGATQWTYTTPGSINPKPIIKNIGTSTRVVYPFAGTYAVTVEIVTPTAIYKDTQTIPVGQ